MRENIYFLNMFSDYEPPETLREALSQAAIVAVDMDMASRTIRMDLVGENYICKRELDSICKDICGIYDMRALQLHITYPESELHNVLPEDLRDMFVQENSATRASLAGASWKWNGWKLTVSLLANGKKELEKCLPAVQSKLREQFGVPVEIEFEANQALEGRELFAAMERMRSELIAERPIPVPAAKSTQIVNPEALYGKPIRGVKTPMSELNLDMGTVIVEGKVFAVEHKELKKRNAWVINFDMTDFTGSIRVNRFMEANEAKPFLENVKEGAVLRIQGRLMINQFDNEMVLRPNAMMLGKLEKRVDKAPGMKRVELHLHTSMSSMDALTDPQTAVKQAAAWGHRAIAITDHGCAHSFPDAMHAVEGKGAAKIAGTDETIKVLYGCEAYFVNDVDGREVVRGDRDMPLNGDFVAFDLETTGLSPENDTIIEIGAVLFSGGKEEKRFQTFVDPKRKLDPEITQLTGISDDMLIGAPSLEAALTNFLEFVGDRMVVAHNARFDTSFVREACTRVGVPFKLSSIDTLMLARHLMPQLQRHKLDGVAKALKLPEFKHHRAVDDSNICGQIFLKFAKMLEEDGYTSVQEVSRSFAGKRSKGVIFAEKPYHILLLAKNQTGLRNLYHLITESNLEYYKKAPRIPKSLLMELREGLIIGSACEAGELFQGILDGKKQAELEKIAEFYDFLEIQPLSNNAFMLRSENPEKPPIAKDMEQLRDFNRKVVALGDATGKPVIATGDVHFLNPEDEIFRHVLLASKGFSDADKPNPLYFRTTDDMLNEFAYLGEEKAYEVVVANTNMIADMCETVRPVPHNLFAPTIQNSAEDLKSLVYGKFRRLYGENPPELMTKRVETELHDIITCHYDVIYMSAQRLVQNSLENGYLVGSRGSVGSSIVAYLSGITEVNSFPPHYRCPNPECKHTILDVPKEYNCGADLPDAVCPLCGSRMEKDGFNIPFETFLGFGGDKVPDIDLNFSGEYQARAHAYCIEMFGSDSVFRAGTIGTVAQKTAFGYVKKYMEEHGKSATAAEMNRLANGCVGVRRTTGQHPGGLVVIPQENEIWDFCPVQHPADDTESDQITTHFEYHSMEENLLKLDMLGHDDPTMIRYMEDITGVDAKTIPLDDEATMSIFTSSKVLGYEDDPILGPTGAVAVPEFNTRFTRGVLLDTMPKKFDFLVRISGYTHGTDVWLGNARDLIMSKTTTVDGTIGCRDDIMLYLISMGLPEKRAFKIMEMVRKGRGLPDGAEEEMKAAGVPDWYIGSCKKIKYLFPKAHAVAYVMMAFRIAWFKVYHPLAFYAAYFYRRSQKGGFDAAMMSMGIDVVKANIEAIDNNENATDKDEDLLTTLEVCYEFYLRGLEFLPIDLYKSDATRFVVEDGKIRLPFVSLSGLGENAALDLVRGREGKHFISIEEVSQACPKVSKTHIMMLKESGAFGDLPDTSQVSLF